MMTPRFVVLLAATLAAVGLRLAPHPENFSPMTAIALFAGANFASPGAAVVVPLAALFVSDVALHLTRFTAFPLTTWMIPVYGSYLMIVVIGRMLRRNRTPLNVACGALAGSLFFFFVTNFWVWAMGRMYPLTIYGLIDCFVAAVPFYRMSLAADALYTTVLFGGFAWAEQRYAALAEPPPAPVVPH